jgi:predicted aspartyl protease
MFRPILTLAIMLASSSALSAQTTNGTTRLEAVSGVPEIDKTSQTEDVSFRNERDDRMTVPVHLSGEGPYRFLVDTGADRSAVSRELADKLRLKSAGGAELHSVSGVSTVNTARVHDLAFTRTPEKSVDAAVLESANIGADGIVGVDLLRSQRIQFDFEKHSMSIVPSRAPDFQVEPGTIVVEARRKNGRLVVSDATANGQPLTIVLDTGSQVTIGNTALLQRLRGRALADPAQRMELLSVTGEKITGDYMFINELTIGGIRLANLAVVFTDAHTFKQLNLDKKPALLLGMNAIRAFKKVSIDFANRKFRVVLPEHSELATQVAAAGL